MIGGLVLTTLRLSRPQLIAMAVLITVIALVLIPDIRVVHAIADQYSTGCGSDGCDALAAEIDRRFGLVARILGLLGLLPAVIGAFWGVPAVGGEYAAGTTRLVFTQSVSPRAWIVAKLTALGGLVFVGGGLVGLIVEFWASAFPGVPSAPSSGAVGDLTDLIGLDHLRGLAPAAWWLFGFAVGALCGALGRRVLPAMVATVAIVALSFVGRNLLNAAISISGGGGLFDMLESASMIGLALALTAATVRVVARSRA